MTSTYYPLRNSFNQNPPQDDPNGLWGCVVDKLDQTSFPFLEVHSGSTWDFCELENRKEDRKVVFRISRFIDNARQEIRLGECVILDRSSAQQLHDHLGRLLEEMK